MFIVVVLILVLISFGGALFSLQGIVKSKKLHKEAAKKLSQGRTIFQAGSHYPPSSEGDNVDSFKRE